MAIEKKNNQRALCQEKIMIVEPSVGTIIHIVWYRVFQGVFYFFLLCFSVYLESHMKISHTNQVFCIVHLKLSMKVSLKKIEQNTT